jgi:hypothetical protein
MIITKSTREGSCVGAVHLKQWHDSNNPCGWNRSRVQQTGSATANEVPLRHIRYSDSRSFVGRYPHRCHLGLATNILAPYQTETPPRAAGLSIERWDTPWHWSARFWDDHGWGRWRTKIRPNPELLNCQSWVILLRFPVLMVCTIVKDGRIAVWWPLND